MPARTPHRAPASAGRSYGGLSHEQRQAQREAALIDAGTQLFASVGYRGATVRAVCQAAQLNDRYFYARFPSMEALLLAVYAQASAGLAQALAEATDAAGPALESRLQAGLRAYFRFMRDERLARILLLEVVGVSPAVDDAYKANLAGFARRLAGLAGDAWTRAGLDKADQRIAATALVGALTSAATYWHLTRYRDAESRMVANCLRVMVGAIRGAAGR